MATDPNPTTDAEAYLHRMLGDEIDVYAIIRWIEKQWEDNGELDHKYSRRVIEAFVTSKGGVP